MRDLARYHLLYYKRMPQQQQPIIIQDVMMNPKKNDPLFSSYPKPTIASLPPTPAQTWPGKLKRATSILMYPMRKRMMMTGLSKKKG